MTLISSRIKVVKDWVGVNQRFGGAEPLFYHPYPFVPKAATSAASISVLVRSTHLPS